MTKIVEKFEKKYDTQIKVIHICGNGFIGKIELYTKLFTLSTENPTNFEVYIVKNRTEVLCRCDKVAGFVKKCRKTLDNRIIEKYKFVSEYDGKSV